MLTGVAQSLTAELAAIGFMPESLGIKLVGARIADRAECEFERLSQNIAPPKRWRALCVHHLGIGASFTEFLIAGLPLEREFKSKVASLGGIAHTIYALFDALLDVSQAPPVLFAGDPRFAADPEIRGKQELVVSLVNLYFQKLSLLSGAPRIHALLERVIRRLHEAELRSAMPRQIERKTWWRKNALPIVVMGLPAWLSTPPESKIRFAEHIMWLGRVGEFLGWLDDFSDYERDGASGHANRLRLENSVSIEAHARRAAAMARRILGFWDSRNGISPARDTFTVIAWTWLTAPESKLAQNQFAGASTSGSEP